MKIIFGENILLLNHQNNFSFIGEEWKLETIVKVVGLIVTLFLAMMALCFISSWWQNISTLTGCISTVLVSIGLFRTFLLKYEEDHHWHCDCSVGESFH